MKSTRQFLFLIRITSFLFLFGFPLLGAAQPLARFITISGEVIDDETGAGIAGANVFIANSLLGGATNSEGQFRISGVPLGTHEIVASFLGYKGESQQVRITDGKDLVVNFKLMPRIYKTGEIEIVAARTDQDKKLLREMQKERALNLKKFKRFFLGVSPNAERCELLNPEVLEFEVNNDTQTFIARASDALVIENRALGYGVRFLLDEFEVREKQRDRSIKYSGKAGFTELTTGSRRERRRWKRNRERAYRGSQRHFLTSLVADQLWQEGYMLVEEGAEQADYSGVPGARPSQRVFTVKPQDVLEPAELSFEHVLNFPGYLKVIYMKGIPDAQYIEFKDYVAGWKLREDDEQQTSWLALTDGPVVITSDGKVQGKYGLTKLGYWFFDRVAEMLPQEYLPESGAFQSNPEALATAAVSPVVSFQEGLRFVEAGKIEEAATGFQKAFNIDPGFSLDGYGTVAYWLGYTYAERNREMEAHMTWAAGMSTMMERNQFDVRLADAYIRDVFARNQVDAYEAATSSYLDILERTDSNLSAEEAAIAERHLTQMFFLLPPDIRDEVLERDVRGYLQRLPLKADAGRTVAAWWRSQDLFPASAVNEQLVEHLKRVFLAEKEFADPQSPVGFDDRGMVFVQYGSPRTRTVIKTDLLDSRKVLQTSAVPLPGPLVIAPNEFWAYQHVNEHLQFVFLLKGGRYQISSPEDLIPDDLRTAYKRIGRRQVTAGSGSLNRVNEAYAKALIAAWQTIYQDLALHHPSFEPQLEKLSSYEADLRATGGITINTSGLDSGANGSGVASTSYSSGLESEFSNLAHTARIQREEEAPQHHTNLLDGIEPLPVAVRASRFLGEEGKTRTEIFWSHIPGTLAPTRKQVRDLEDLAGSVPDRYLIQMAVVQHKANHERETTNMLRYTAVDLPKGSPAPVQTFDVVSDDTTYHLSMQWSQHRYSTDTASGEVEPHEELKLGMQHLKNLGALSSENGVLEMSDLKPVYLGEDNSYFLAETDGNGPAIPPAYPFLTITQDTQLGLYFELYELAFGPDDKTHFTVSYQIERDARRTRKKQTSASSSYTTETRVAKEYIALDLGEFGDRGTLNIRVTVTDDVTKQSVSREISFNLTGAESK